MKRTLSTLFLTAICGLVNAQLLMNNASQFPQLKIIAEKLNSITNYQADCDLVMKSHAQGTTHAASTLIIHKVPSDTLCGFYYYFKTHEQYKKSGGDFIAFFNNACYFSINNAINETSLFDKPERFKEVKFQNRRYIPIHRSSKYILVVPKEVSKFISNSLASYEVIIVQKPDTLISGKYCVRYIFEGSGYTPYPKKEICFEKESYKLLYYKGSTTGWDPDEMKATLSNIKIDQPLAENYFSEENLFGRKLGKNTAFKPCKFEVGEVVSDWELPVLGKMIKCSSKALRGKYVLLEFTGTWCPHCGDAVSMMNRLEEKFKGNNNLSILSVFSTQSDDAEKITKFAHAHNIKSTILYSATSVGDNYGIIGYPTFLMIDPNGKLGLVISGYGQDAENEIVNYLTKNVRNKN